VLVLLVLSVLGLSLAFVTQTEMIIGSQERTIQRSFYAADAGLDVTILRIVRARDADCNRLDFVDPNGPLFDRIRTTIGIPIQEAACNLCSINPEDSSKKVSYLIGAKSERLAANNTPVATKAVELMADLEPLLHADALYMDELIALERGLCDDGSSYDDI
jgi:hypothetical protein